MENYQETDKIHSLSAPLLQSACDIDQEHEGESERTQTLCILPEWLRLLRSNQGWMAVNQAQ